MVNAEELMIKITSFLSGDGFAKTQKAMSQVQAEQGKQQTYYQRVAQAGVQSNTQIANSYTKITQQLGPVGTAINGMYNTITSGASKVVSAASSIAPPFIRSWAQAASSSNVLNNAFNSVQSGVGHVVRSAGEIANKFGQAFSQAAKSASDFISNLEGIDGVVAGVLGAIGVQNIGEMIFGNTSKAEVNKVLLSNMTQTEQGAKKLFNTIDQATNKTLVSMQSVIPAVNAFKAATGATESTLNAVSPGVAQFGSYVYAMTGSAAQAEGAMFDLSKGIKGAYASLDQYGITEDSLMATGLWTGKTDDVEGYIEAVNAVTGSTDELMGTFQGLQATITKTFSVAGKTIGNALLPVLKGLAQGFLDLNKATGGGLATAILLVGGGLSAVLVAAGAIGALLPVIISGIGILTPGLTAATAAKLGFAGSVHAASASLVGFIVSEKAATVATWSLSTALWNMATALLANPITWIIIAILALIVAIQELGKYMGWWKDWGTMIDAFSAGLKRLWAAFVNNPQVLATVNQIKAAWEGLMQILSPIGKALTSFWNSLFPENKAGEGFDIVRGIIDVFGLFGEAVANFLSNSPIGIILSNLDAIGAAFQSLYSVLSGVVGSIVGALTSIGQFFSNIWANITEFFLSSFYDESGKWLGVIPGITNLIQKINEAILKGLLALPGLIMSGLTTLWNIGVKIGEAIYNSLTQIPGIIAGAITSIPGLVIGALTSLASTIGGSAESVDWSGILNGIIGFIISIPYRIIAAVSNIASNSVNMLGMIIGFLFGEDVGNAFNEKAQGIISTITTFLMSLPSKVIEIAASAFGGGVDIINMIFGSFSEAGSQVILFFQQLWIVLQQVGTFLMSVFKPAWDLIISTFMIIWQHVQFMITIFTALLQGQMTLAQALQAIWTVISSLFTSVLSNIISRVVSFGSNLLSRFRSAFSNAVNTAKSFITQLPGIVWQEMMNIVAKIGQAAGAIFAKVKEVFGNVVKWAMEALGMSSPGTISKMMGKEMGWTLEHIKNMANPARIAASELGKKIVSGFGNPVLPSIGNEGVDPYEYDPTKSGSLKWPFVYDTGDFPISTSAGALILKESSKKDSGVTVGKIEVKNTINVDGASGDPEEIAAQIEQKLASSLPADIMETLIKLLNSHNISNGNVN